MLIKRRILPLILGIILTVSLIPETGSFAMAETADDQEITLKEGTYEEGVLLVVTEKGTTEREVEDLAEEVDGDVDQVASLLGDEKIATIAVDDDSLLESMEKLEADESVRIAQPNYIHHIQSTETMAMANDSTAGSQTYLKAPNSSSLKGAVDAFGAWDELTIANLSESKKPLVAIIDTGLDLDHEDLQANVEKDKCVTYNGGFKMGFDAMDGSYDDTGHGTHVGGIIAATTNNGLGVAGVANNQIRLFAVDVSLKSEGITSIDVSEAIDYSIRQGAKVINISIGDMEKRDRIMEAAVENAWNRGVLCVCAGANSYRDTAGKYHADSWCSPGDSPYAISVMNHQINGNYHYTSNYGVEKDVSAPGTSIWSTTPVTSDYPNGNYETKTGTSMASPVVAGIVALLLAEANGTGKSLSPRQLKNLIYTSSGNDGFSSDKSVGGFGHVNAKTALQNLKKLGAKATKVVLNKTSITMEKGETEALEYEVLPGNTDDVNVTYSSSDTAVAAVDDDGNITAKSDGVSRIIATTKGGKQKSCVVIVGEGDEEALAAIAAAIEEEEAESDDSDNNSSSSGSSSSTNNSGSSNSVSSGSNVASSQTGKSSTAGSTANTAGGTISTAITARINKPSIATVGNFANKTMTVKASGVSDATYYRIAYRKAGSGTWQDRWVGSKGIGLFSKLQKGQLWEYRVAAYKKINGTWYRSKWSSISRRYIANTKAAKKVKKKKGFTVTLKKVTGATGYQLSYATKKSMKGAKSITHGKNGIKFNVKKRKAKKKYYLQYRPIKKYQGKNYLGIWMNTSIKTK